MRARQLLNILANAANIAKAQVSLKQTFIYARAVGVNFNSANTDTAIPIVLPQGFTKYRIPIVRIVNPSGALNTATCGLFTAAAAGGVALITNPTAITITTAANATNNNSQAIGGTNNNTMSITATTIYFRVITPQGVAATGDVLIEIEPLA